MKVLQIPKLKIDSLGEGVKWIDIVTKENGVGFTRHELHIQGRDASFNMNPKGNHIYYVIHGGCKVELSDKSVYKLQGDSLLAVPQWITGTIMCDEGVDFTRILIFYAQSDIEKPDLAPVMRKLSDIIGGPRDIDFGGGHSRRFLSQPDGFGLSVNNTFADPGRKTELEFTNQIESNYLLTGNWEYSWNGGKDKVKFTQEKAADGNGVVILLDQHDKHWVQTFSNNSCAICCFYPPLKGTESTPSSY